MLAVFSDLLLAVFPDDADESAFTGVAGGELGGQVAFALVRSAHVGEQEGHDVLIDYAAPENLYGRNAQAFLEDLAGWAHRTREGSADVGVVRAIGDIERGALTSG